MLIQSGIAPLDEQVGGLLPGRPYVVSGNPGTGKSVSCLEFLDVALERGEPAALLAYFGNYWDLYWVLDDAQQQQLLALPPSAWDNDRAAWAIVRAQTYQLRGCLPRLALAPSPS